MARQADVIPGEPIEAAWGNPIRDTTIQRTASEAQRDIEWPIPVLGDLAFIEDLAEIQFYDGTSWVGVPIGDFLPLGGGTMAGDLSMAGFQLLALGQMTMQQDAVHDLGGPANRTRRVYTTELRSATDALIATIGSGTFIIGTTTAAAAVRNVHQSTSDPTGGDGIDGDVWLTYS